MNGALSQSGATDGGAQFCARTSKGRTNSQVSADHLRTLIEGRQVWNQTLRAHELRHAPTEVHRAATQSGHAVWLGYNVADGEDAKSFKSNGNYIIGRIGDPNRQPPLKALRLAADILVTDEAERYDGIIELTAKSQAAYEACLAE